MQLAAHGMSGNYPDDGHHVTVEPLLDAFAGGLNSKIVVRLVEQPAEPLYPGFVGLVCLRKRETELEVEEQFKSFLGNVDVGKEHTGSGRRGLLSPAIPEHRVVQVVLECV